MYTNTVDLRSDAQLSELAESIVAVDSNYEVMWRHRTDLRRYEYLLERAIKICTCLTKNQVLYPTAHLFENSVFTEFRIIQ